MRLITLTAAALVTLTAVAHAQTVRIATEGAYAPFNFVDDDGNAAGFEIVLGNEICARAELSCEWIVTAWDTMIPNLLASNYDVIMAGMSITEERMESINFSAEYYPPDPHRYAIRSGQVVDFSNMTGLRIGAQSATIHLAHIEANFSDGNTILSYETFDQAIADLAAGNLDVVLADGGFVEPIIAASNGALEIAGPPVMIGGGVGAGIRKEDSALLDAFNTAIESIKADGLINALLIEWFENPVTFD